MALYGGKKVELNKPKRIRNSKKEFRVFVKHNGKIKKIEFGDKKMRLNAQFESRRKSYCARSKPLSQSGDKTSANYWSRKRWKCKNP